MQGVSRWKEMPMKIAVFLSSRMGKSPAYRTLTEELKALLPDCKALLRGRLDATLAVHLGPHLLGAGIQFL